MLDQLKEEVETLRYTKEFIDYKSKHPNAYLCAGFKIIDHLGKIPWQIDFYCPDKKIITTFIFDKSLEQKETNEISPAEEEIKELNLENIDIDFSRTLEIIDKIIQEKYPTQKSNKIVVILQKINGIETWNISHLTDQFNILNIYINAQTGEVIKEKLQQVISFKQN